jgi:hypothetical protein
MLCCFQKEKINVWRRQRLIDFEFNVGSCRNVLIHIRLTPAAVTGDAFACP